MENKGAFITLNGKDMKPKFTSYEAVVSVIIHEFLDLEYYFISI